MSGRRVRVAELVLHEHVDAMPEMDPPEVAVVVFQRFAIPIVLKGHFSQLVEAVCFVEAVEGRDVGIAANVPVFIGEASYCFGIFA